MEPKGRNDLHKFSYSKITDQIYLGSDFCKAGICKIHGEEFKKLGVCVEINLSEEENEVPPRGIDSYVWLPVVDGHAPNEAQLNIGTSVINEAVESGKKVYVHCKNGHGRSPTMLAAYFIRYKGKAVDQVIGLIEEKRSEVHIEKNQKEALRLFSKGGESYE